MLTFMVNQIRDVVIKGAEEGEEYSELTLGRRGLRSPFGAGGDPSLWQGKGYKNFLMCQDC